MWERSIRVIESLKERVLNDFWEDEHRLFFWMPVVFVAGIGCYFSLLTEPSWFVMLWVGSLALLAFVLRLLIRSGWSFLFLALFFFFAGIIVAKLETFRVVHPILTQRVLEGEILEGRIIFADYPGPRGQTLLLEVLTLNMEEAPQPFIARMKWYGKPLPPGKSITFNGRLYAPGSPVEPSSYHQARRLFFSSIGATGVIDTVESIGSFHPEGFWQRLSIRLEKGRWHLAEHIYQAFTGESDAYPIRGALAVALVTGMRGGMDIATWDQIRTSGLAHLLAISGLHMGLICGLIFWLLRTLFALSPALTLRFRVRCWAALGAFLVGLCYLLISGMSLSAMRAFIMVGMMLFAIMLNRRALTMRNVVLAALLILGIWPHSLLEAGFLMSFTITAALISTIENWERFPFWKTLFFSSGIAFFVSSLLSLWLFNRTALYALPVNMLILPWMSFIVMPFLFLVVILFPFGLHTLFLPFGQWGLDGILGTTHWISELSQALVWLPSMLPMGVFCLFVGGLWVMIWQARWRYWGFVPMVIGLMGVIFLPKERPTIVISPGADVVGILETKNAKRRLLAGSGTYAPLQWYARDGGLEQERLSRTRKHFQHSKSHGEEAQCFVGVCFLTETTYPKTLIIGYVWRFDVLKDACHHADVVIVRMQILVPRCGEAFVLTSLDTYCVGSVSLWWDGEKLRVLTAKQWDGVRPWTIPWQRAFPSWLFAHKPFQEEHYEQSTFPSWQRQCFRKTFQRNASYGKILS